ncbi:hypothetical protein CRG98_031486 [Punica granatum]|uniref:Uncharacterized protein n=1 Tax=Punica granatum TaxID=22663 RepID=A0A2I0IVW1_PUNGR|nr:hypothetical protein CRG98_031486 [Punica granatum]
MIMRRRGKIVISVIHRREVFLTICSSVHGCQYPILACLLPTRITRSKLGSLFTVGPTDADVGTRRHELQGRDISHQGAQEGQSEGSLMFKPGHPRTFAEAFLKGAPGRPDPRTNKRHPKTGLHTPEGHQDLGTDFLSTIPATKGPLSNGISRLESIQGNVDVRAPHHPLPTTPRG